MPVVDVNGARLWYDEAGEGEPVLLLHGGLGDSELWEPVVPFLAERFRVLRTDLRFYGRSTGPAAPFSHHEDVLGVLDELGIPRAALVGLSLGGGLAFDLALDAPERVRAVVGVAPSLSGDESPTFTDEQIAAFEEAVAAGDRQAALEIGFAVWAPLGADERIRRLWFSTPDANDLPADVRPRPPREPALGRLDRLTVPALVVTVGHDPSGMRALGPLVAREAPDARHVELDSDHYVTLREPEAVARVLLEFL